LAKVDWDHWFYAPGLTPRPDFDTSLVDVCYKLADSWKDGSFKPQKSDIDGWVSGQVVVFLERITDFEKPLSKDQVELMKETYGFLNSQNAEILSRFFTVALTAKDETMYPRAAEALGRWGRMKFVRPLYRLLNTCDRDLALKTFEKNKTFYHPICRSVVEKDLGL